MTGSAWAHQPRTLGSLALDRFMQPTDRNAQHGDVSRIVDGLAVGHEFEGLVHDQRPLEPIPEHQAPPARFAGHGPGGIAQRSRVMVGRGLGDQPGPASRWFAKEDDGLVQPEASIRFGDAKAFHPVGSLPTEEDLERAVSFALARECVRGREGTLHGLLRGRSDGENRKRCGHEGHQDIFHPVRGLG